ESAGRVRFVKDFYGPATAVPADVVVCRHVIEHVPEPLELLRTVRAAVGESGKTRVFFETPCVEWILRHRVPWDFFYEHCSLFTAASLALAMKRAGFAVSTVRHVFGGQYLWAEGVSGSPAWGFGSPQCLREAGQAPDSRLPTPDSCLKQWNQLLADLSSRGAMYVWGAGAKGVTFCNLADPDSSRIAAVIDMNPAKQGKFLPGTAHAIVSPAHARNAGAVLVLNPNYVAEVRAAVERLGSRAAVIDLMEEATSCAW
ncbi:MAG TPA: class I SAM-dependent methyltransferase, partial [Gemmata sp.]|nr:class I SAM-dependent methyltransferase [Gemmata sp.]